ncbi:MAG: metallophosphoesterase [Fusobacterium sp.]|nr:metallophosphoesterase [Fusobacterium sp.]
MIKNLPIIISIFIFILLGVYSLFIEPNKLNVNHYKVQDIRLKGIKIVFASDLHIKPHQQKRLEKIIETINAESPDLVLSVGDFVSGHNEKMTMPIEDISKELGKVKAKYGFYTTLGNHEGWYDSEKVTKVLQDNGIQVLANANISIQLNGKKLYIAGVEDLTTGKPNINKALAGTKAPTILLTHSPDLFVKVPEDISLTLAGHTHGGQIRLPLIGAIFTASDFGNKYAKGFIEENGKKLITTTGIGTSILPIRFNCTPEIVVIEF